MPTVGISVYWNTWLNRVVESRVRKSKTEIVEEGLKKVKWSIDNEVDEFELARKEVMEKKELDRAIETTELESEV